MCLNNGETPYTNKVVDLQTERRRSDFMRIINVATIVVFLCLFVGAFWLPSAQAQGEGNAKLTKVKYEAMIPSETSDTWSFTVHNINCSENDEGMAQFFFEFYVDGLLSFDEYNSTTYRTWNCTEGHTVTLSYPVVGWSTSVPEMHDIRVELYWFYNGTSRLEDTALFNVDVTVFMPLQDIYATSYLVLYLGACFLLLMYDYLLSLEE
jgi:hypothetical protein